MVTMVCGVVMVLWCVITHTHVVCDGMVSADQVDNNSHSQITAILIVMNLRWYGMVVRQS